MRELKVNEVRIVSGGNIPGIIGAVALGWQIGVGTGNAVNFYNSSKGRSFGRSLYKAFH